MKTDRRSFLKASGAGAACLAAPRWVRAATARSRPNIIFIVTDQQYAGMMGCAGNPHVKTPAMDRLAASGVRFERAYASNPVCLPARFSFFTGRMPSAVGIGENRDGRRGVPREMVEQSMGPLFRAAGYETVYGGKVHLPKGMGHQRTGFRNLTGDSRGKLANACAQFLKQRHEKPFLLVASFINPHDICYMAINDFRRTRGQQPVGNRDSNICEGLIKEPRANLRQFVEEHCPPLPGNHDVPALEPEGITDRYLKVRKFRLHAREKWSADLWRLHRWAYCRLTEMVDAHVGKVLDAVQEAGLEDDTLIVFTSDHGDHDASHKLEHKSILYEEAARVPFVMSHRGAIPAGAVDQSHLVSNGLDLLPTLCDYAGIEPSSDLLGTSMRPLAEARATSSWRTALPVESQNGRMLRTDRFKYVVYDSGAHREQLFDLRSDPSETKNLAYDETHQATVAEHRKLLAKWVMDAGDEIGKRYVPGA